MDNFTLGVILGAALLAGTTRTQAQVNASDSVMPKAINSVWVATVKWPIHAISTATMSADTRLPTSTGMTLRTEGSIFLMRLSTLATTSARAGQWERR